MFTLRYIFLFFCFFVLSSNIIGQNNLKSLQNSKKRIIEELRSSTELLKKSKNDTQEILKNITLINAQIESRKELIIILEKELAEINKQQKATQKSILELEKSLLIKKDSYHRTVKAMMRNNVVQNNATFMYMLSGKSLSESYKRFSYLKDYSKWLKAEAEAIREDEAKLKEKQESLDNDQKQMSITRAQYNFEQSKLADQEQEIKAQLEKAKEKENELQAVIKRKQNEANQLDAQIQKLVEQEQAKQLAKIEEEKKKNALEVAKTNKEKKVISNSKNSNNKNNIAKNTAASNNKTQPQKEAASKPAKNVTASTTEADNLAASKSFLQSKGSLPAPISGKYSIIGKFGVKKQNNWVTTNNNGIDIRGEANAKAQAVYSGEVSSIVAIPGYGTCIMVRHGDYYTFYGNIKQINVKKGDQVKVGQILGTIFTDTKTSNSELHFQLWKQKEKLNPEHWLKR